MKVRCISLMVSVVISACGGGGGSNSAGGGNTSTPVESRASITPVPSVALVVEPAIAESAPLATDLVVNPVFSFSSEGALNLEITSQYNGEHFVSLCIPVAGDENSLSDCIYSGLTTFSSFKKSFQVANSIDSLVLRVWNLQYQDAPSLFTWRRSDSFDWLVDY